MSDSGFRMGGRRAGSSCVFGNPASGIRNRESGHVPPKPRRGEGGFTLIELIAVIAIMGLMMMIATVRMDYLIPKYKLRGAAREIGAAMKQGRARAVATGRDVFFEIDLSQGRYWLLAAFPRRDEDDFQNYWEPLEEVTQDPLEAILAPEEDRARSLVYEPIFVRSLPGNRPGKRPEIEFVDVIFGQQEIVRQGVARIRLSPFGASEHTIVNLKNFEGRELAVKMNGFTGNLSFYAEYKEADLLLEDAGF